MPTVFETQPQQQPEEGYTPPSQGVPEAKPINLPHRDRMTLFTSYAERPEGVRFETQQDEEEVIIFMRQHFSVNVAWILTTILLAAAPFGVIPFVFKMINVLPPIPPQYYIVGTLFWYVATFGYALLNFIRWYYNLYIVTTERVIDIDFIQLLYKKFSEARLTSIEDVSYTASGFMATLFNYGNITIQTAGEASNFDFDYIPRPADVVKTIGGLLKKAHGK